VIFTWNPTKKISECGFRIDGILYNMMNLPCDSGTPSFPHQNHAKLDISEKRLPQDGRIKTELLLMERKRRLISCFLARRLYSAKNSFCVFGSRHIYRLDMSKLGFEEVSLKRVERHP